jgi:hypothetical protein
MARLYPQALGNRLSQVNYVSSFYNFRRTEERTLPPTFRVLVWVIRCQGNVLTEPLSSEPC